MSSPSDGQGGPIRSVLAHWDAYEWEFRVRHGESSPLSEVFLPEFAQGDVEGAILAVGGDSREHCIGHDDPLVGALRYQHVVRADLEAHPGATVLVRQPGDVDRARAAGRPWFALALEGCRPLRGSTDILAMFVRLGVRVVGLTWNGRNEAADGVGIAQPGGLTPFGERVVDVANGAGLLLDVSHLGTPGLWETLERSTAPVIASHSNARALADHPRNLPDEALRAIAAGGGVVGVSFISSHLRVDGQAQVSDIVDQVTHLTELLGVEHVCLGPDFTYDPWRREMAANRSYEGAPAPNMSLRHPVHRPQEMSAVPAALLERGFQRREVEAICNGNVVALLRKVLGSDDGA